MRLSCGDDFLVTNSHVVMVSSARECHNPETEIDGGDQ